MATLQPLKSLQCEGLCSYPLPCIGSIHNPGLLCQRSIRAQPQLANMAQAIKRLFVFRDPLSGRPQKRHKSEHVSSSEWNKHYATIYDLYIVQNLSNKEVQKIMREKHNFNASLVHSRTKSMRLSDNLAVHHNMSEYFRNGSSVNIKMTALLTNNR